MLVCKFYIQVCRHVFILISLAVVAYLNFYMSLLKEKTLKQVFPGNQCTKAEVLVQQ